MSQQYTEEKLAQIQNDIMSGMDKEKEQHREVEEMSISIGDRVLKNKHCREVFLDKEYVFTLTALGQGSNQTLVLFVTDPFRMEIVGRTKYTPARYAAQLDLDYTYAQNVYTLVKAALFNKMGIIKVEEEA